MAKRTQAARMLQKVGSLEVRPSLLKAGPRLSAVRNLLIPVWETLLEASLSLGWRLNSTTCFQYGCVAIIIHLCLLLHCVVKQGK